MTVINASEARRTLPAQIDRVERGERVSITRHGRVVAILVSPDDLALRPQSVKLATQLAERLQAARSQPLPVPVIDPARADALVSDIDTERGGR